MAERRAFAKAWIAWGMPARRPSPTSRSWILVPDSDKIGGASYQGRCVLPKTRRGDPPMERLEGLTRGASIRGVLPDGLVIVVDVQWHSSATAELIYKDASG